MILSSVEQLFNCDFATYYGNVNIGNAIESIISCDNYENANNGNNNDNDECNNEYLISYDHFFIYVITIMQYLKFLL